MGRNHVGVSDHPRFTLILNDPAALRRIIQSPSELSLGEAYIFDELDIEGDFQAAFDVGEYLIARGKQNPSSAPLLAKLLSFPEPKIENDPVAALQGIIHSKERDRQAVRYHYDLPSEFYALWLDSKMMYSCAYFDREDEDLETAQFRKLDYICKKLRLSPGDRLLDIGCGWGGLLLHAVSNYKVDALGASLSPSVRPGWRVAAFTQQD